MITSAAAVLHNAAMCSRSRPPCRPANSASPAQNDGSISVIGDCNVAKNAVTSGIDSTRNSRSGWMNRNSNTMLMANTSPINIRMSRDRRAGNTLTSISVTAEPMAIGMTTNGTTISSAVPTNNGDTHLAVAIPARTGTRNTTTIHPACATVRANRARNNRRGATGAASTSRRSSERKNVESAATMPLKARNERNVRNSHDSPMRIR